MRDVLAVFMHLEQKRKGLTPQPMDIYSNRYSSYKDRLIKAEREILKELGFILYTEHPHKFILNYVKLLTADEVPRADAPRPPADASSHARGQRHNARVWRVRRAPGRRT